MNAERLMACLRRHLTPKELEKLSVLVGSDPDFFELSCAIRTLFLREEGDPVIERLKDIEADYKEIQEILEGE